MPNIFANLVNPNRTKQLVLCVLLSVFVHAGLAATFVNALSSASAPLEIIRPIQVTLFQDDSNTVGDSESDSPNSNEPLIQGQDDVEVDGLDHLPSHVIHNARDTIPTEFSVMEGEQSRQETETVVVVDHPSEHTVGASQSIEQAHQIETVEEIVDNDAEVLVTNVETQSPHTNKVISTITAVDDAATPVQSVDESIDVSMPAVDPPETIADLTQLASANPIESDPDATVTQFEPTVAEILNLEDIEEPDISSLAVGSAVGKSVVADLSNMPVFTPINTEMHEVSQNSEASSPSDAEVESDWDQIVSALPSYFDEAYDPISENSEPILRPVAQTTPAVASQIASIDFDSEIVRWTQTEQEPDARLGQKFELESTTPIAKQDLVIEVEADQIAGILPHPEIPVEFSPDSAAPTYEIDVTNTVFVEPEIRLASIADFDSQTQQLAWPESDVPAVTESELATEITPAEQITTVIKKSSKTSVENPRFRNALRTQIEQNLEAFVKSNTTLAQAEKIPPIPTDADQLAGILPRAESLESIPPINSPLTTEIHPKDSKSTQADTQVVVATDFDTQVQPLAWPESDEISVNESERIANEAAVEQLAASVTDSNQKSTQSTVPQQIKAEETTLAKVDESTPKTSEKSTPSKQSKDPNLSLPATAKRSLQSAVVPEAAPTIDQELKHSAEKVQLASTQSASQPLSQDEQYNSETSQQQASLSSISQEMKPRYGVRGLPNPAPRYPYKSRTKGEQGKVILQVVVNRKGRADEITVVQSSGYSRLDKAARKAVKKWKFQPAQKDGRSTRGIVQVPISFVLENS